MDTSFSKTMKHVGVTFHIKKKKNFLIVKLGASTESISEVLYSRLDVSKMEFEGDEVIMQDFSWNTLVFLLVKISTQTIP